MTARVVRTIVFSAALFLAAGSGRAGQTVEAAGTLNGCVEVAGLPAYRGVAALWPAAAGKGPDPRRAIRPPVASAPLQANGCFTLQAPAGEYFVGAVVRQTDGGWQGPPRPGDLVFLSPDASDSSFRTTVTAGETVDIGRHADGWIYSGFTSTNTSLAISGTLTGIDGKPLSGLLVFAFTDSTMSKDPVAVSEPTDGSGRFLLRVPEPATVYLRAREHYGRRSPLEGGYMGVYGADRPIPVTIDADAGRQDCSFTVLLVPSMEMRQGGKTTKAPEPKKN